MVVPEPPNGSRMMAPRRLQSLIASATRSTGLTVGCSSKSSRRPSRKLLTPTYSQRPCDVMARKAARVREIAGLKALSFAQSDRHGRHLGVALWPYRDRLLVTLDPHVETGREAGASHLRNRAPL